MDFIFEDSIFKTNNKKWVKRTNNTSIELIRESGLKADVKINSRTVVRNVGYVEAEYIYKLLEWYFNTDEPWR